MGCFEKTFAGGIAGLAANLRTQPAHAAQPAIIIVRLVAEIFRDFRVWQNQEALFCESCYHSFSDNFRLDRAGPQKILPLALRVEQHLREDALGTQT